MLISRYKQLAYNMCRILYFDRPKAYTREHELDKVHIVAHEISLSFCYHRVFC